MTDLQWLLVATIAVASISILVSILVVFRSAAVEATLEEILRDLSRLRNAHAHRSDVMLAILSHHVGSTALAHMTQVEPLATFCDGESLRPVWEVSGEWSLPMSSAMPVEALGSGLAFTIRL